MPDLVRNDLTLDSREVAEMVEKNHSHLLRDIRTYQDYISTNPDLDSSDFFILSSYLDGKSEERSNYQVTKKGCEFIAHKLTGQKGALFTATYINRFHEMEEYLGVGEKETQMISTDLSPELQMFNQMLQAMAKTELKQKELELAQNENKKEIQDMRDVIKLDTTSWRKDTAELISRIAVSLGGFEYIKDIRQQSYNLLDERMGVALSIRLTNKRRRMADEGVSKSKRDKLNYLDIIAEDKKLIEGYVAIVKEMAIKYKIA